MNAALQTRTRADDDINWVIRGIYPSNVNLHLASSTHPGKI